MENISLKDKQILRDLAKKQYEYSHLPQMEQLKKEWVLHNDCNGGRPMITIALWTFYNDVIPPLLRCEGETARSIEIMLLGNMVNYELFKDDTVVKDYIPVSYPHRTYFKPFDIDIKVEHALSDSNSLGHHFADVIKDLKDDFHLLKKSSFGVIKDANRERQHILSELLGDILPVKLAGGGVYVCPTQNIVHIMSMETMLLSMYDYPDEFKCMISNLVNDYLEYFEFIEKEELILPSVSGEPLGNGTFNFTEDLPGYDVFGQRPFKVKDVWGFMDSQETVGISPDMFEEFIFPYYKKIADRSGLLSYGCCEPVNPIWENCLSKLKNLRKISISPWCNEEYMGEQLRDKKIVYLRKPSPNFLGVGRELDENALRAHIKKTVKAARGCNLEIAQCDVYSINNSTNKVKRYVEIIREECENF